MANELKLDPDVQPSEEQLKKAQSQITNQEKTGFWTVQNFKGMADSALMDFVPKTSEEWIRFGASVYVPGAAVGFYIGEEIEEGAELDVQELDRLRFQEQCFLIEHYDQIVEKNFATRYKNFTCVHGDPNRVVTNLNSHEDLEALVNITPDQLARLQPKFRLFKTFFNAKGEEVADLEFKFDEYADQESLADTITVNRGDTEIKIPQHKVSRGGGVGLKKFDWKYRGVNPAEASNIIEAEMVLRFENMYELTKVRRGIATNGEEVKYRFVDLLLPEKKKVNAAELKTKDREKSASSWDVNIPRYDRTKIYNPNYFSFKVDVGWNDASKYIDQDDPRYKDLMKALEKDRKTFVLTLTRHNIDFSQEGPVEVTMFANARFDIASSSPESDVFNLYQSRIKVLKDSLSGVSKRKKTINKNCKDKVGFKETRKEVNEELKQDAKNLEKRINLEKQRVYAALMQDLVDCDRVFNVEIPFEQIGLYQEDIYWGLLQEQKLRSNEFLATNRSSNRKQTPNIIINKLGESTIGSFLNNCGSDKVEDAHRRIKEEVDQQQKQRIDQEAETYNIPFIFLGDILEVGLEALFGPNNPYTNKSKMLVSDYIIEDPRTKERVSINLADIPVSLAKFKQWFLHNVYSKARDTYPAKHFIKNVVEGLITESIAPEACFYGVNSRTVKVSTTSFILPRSNGEELLDPQNCGRIFLNKLLNIEEKAKNTTDVTTYYMLFSYDSNPEDMVSNYLEDAKRGIFHFGLGLDQGLIKTINFDRTDLKYLREARLVGDSGENSFRRLREVYNIKVDMVGNDIYRPGQLLYVNPSTLAFGSENNPESAGHALGLVGYYQIIDVDSYIEPGKFETKITAKWVSSGLGKQVTNMNKPGCDFSDASKVRTMNFNKTKVKAPENNYTFLCPGSVLNKIKGAVSEFKGCNKTIAGATIKRGVEVLTDVRDGNYETSNSNGNSGPDPGADADFN